MNIEILETPLRFELHGKSSQVEDNRYGDIGMKLMNDVWTIVRETSTKTKGINHWVYLDSSQMFVGVELAADAISDDRLEPITVELHRYLKHVHIGPYQALPQKWQSLRTLLAERGEKFGSPGLEIYGHHCDDASKQETTILISLS